MKHLFRRTPLSVKLVLIGIIPFLFLIYLANQVYQEEKNNLALLEAYRERVLASEKLNRLIDELQNERKYSFDFAMKKVPHTELLAQRPKTDSALVNLERTKDETLIGFRNYTFLNDLDKTRRLIDTAILTPDIPMTYYTGIIFRLNTLNSIPAESNNYLENIYKNLSAQKLLSQTITYLGIIRSNIYTVLRTGQFGQGTLYGLKGLYDINNSYETEFLMKAPPEAIASYKKLEESGALRDVSKYLEVRFKTFDFDSTYNADQWWAISDSAVDELSTLQQSLRSDALANLETIYHKEESKKDRMLILLIIALVIVIGIILYTIYDITKSLHKLKSSAEALSRGATGIDLDISSNDAIGSLAKSVALIDNNNKRLADATNEIGNGNFNADVTPRSKEDILGNAIVRMKNNIQQLIRDSEESKQQFRFLASRLQEVREEERASMAREVHDELGQQITGLKMDVSWVSKRITTEDPQIRQKLNDILSLLDKTVGKVREIAAELRPSLLDDLGLSEALAWQSEEFEKRSGIRTDFQTNLSGLIFPSNIGIALFRIYQECLTNIARHSAASKVSSSLHLKNENLVLTISDNGKGFDPNEVKKKKTLGMLGMKERTAMLGGKYEINSTPGMGTTVEVTTPAHHNGVES